MTWLNSRLTSARLLDRFDRFRGSIHDVSAGTRVSADSLRFARDRLYRAFRERVLPGDLVLLSLPNGPLFLAALHAVLQSGAAPVLVHPDSPDPERRRVAQRYQARFSLCEAEAEHPPAADDADAAVRISIDGIGACVLTELAGVDARQRPYLAGVPLHPTSGTTGVPKLAVRPPDAATAEADHYVETLGIDARDVILCVTPMTHAYAFGMGVAVPMASSASVVTMRRFAPRAAIKTIRELGVTVLAAVPIALDGMLSVTSGPFSAPQCVLSAGAPLGATTARRFADLTGAIVRPLYGTTETGGISIAPAGASDADTVGAPMNGVEMRLRSSDAGTERGAVGLLEVRSSSMMAGYLGADGIDDTILDEGWFGTGDLAEIEDGAVHLRGRQKDVINVFGMKVVPMEVENVIATDHRVAAVKVYAGRHASGSESVMAAVVARDGFQDANAIRHLCLRHLVAFKCPSEIHFLAELPRTASGKIVNRELPGAIVPHGGSV